MGTLGAVESVLPRERAEERQDPEAGGGSARRPAPAPSGRPCSKPSSRCAGGRQRAHPGAIYLFATVAPGRPRVGSPRADRRRTRQPALLSSSAAEPPDLVARGPRGRPGGPGSRAGDPDARLDVGALLPIPPAACERHGPPEGWPAPAREPGPPGRPRPAPRDRACSPPMKKDRGWRSGRRSARGRPGPAGREPVSNRVYRARLARCRPPSPSLMPACCRASRRIRPTFEAAPPPALGFLRSSPLGGQHASQAPQSGPIV